jgi:integrase
VERVEVAILTADQIADTLRRIEDHPLHSIAALAVATGMRRGEIYGLTWGAFNFDAATVRVECSLEETAAGLRIKPPKTRQGLRTISLPKSTVEILREHHRRQLEQRLLLGLGRPGAEDWVFPLLDGSPYPSRQVVSGLGERSPRSKVAAGHVPRAPALARVRFNRGRHGSPAITLGVYAHLFNRTDSSAAQAMEKALGSNLGPNP